MAIVTVLTVDDEQAILDLMRLFLGRDGLISIEPCLSAPDAIERMKNSRFDAIVSDFEMTGMDGIEFLQLIRGRGDSIPFIIFTGKGGRDIAAEAVRCGADFYLEKGGDPRIRFNELRSMIIEAVSRRKTRDALNHIPGTEGAPLHCGE